MYEGIKTLPKYLREASCHSGRIGKRQSFKNSKYGDEKYLDNKLTNLKRNK